MKKLLILVLMLAVVCAVFAQEAAPAAPAAPAPAVPAQDPVVMPEFVPATAPYKSFDVEFLASIPYHWTEDESDGIRENTTNGIALGVAFTKNFTRKFGLTLDLDVSYVKSLEGIPVSGSGNDSSFYSYVTANALLGPVVYIYSGNFLKVPLGFGFHYYYYSGEHWDNDGVMTNPGDWYKYSDHQMGVGFYLGTQFHFNRNLYIAARTTVSYDVFHFASVSGNVAGVDISESKTGMISGLGVKPAIGLGIKF